MTPARFKSIRHGLGLSLRGLAAALGISAQRTIRHWESGTKPVTGPVARLMTIFERNGVEVLDDTDYEV